MRILLLLALLSGCSGRALDVTDAAASDVCIAPGRVEVTDGGLCGPDVQVCPSSTCAVCDPGSSFFCADPATGHTTLYTCVDDCTHCP